MERADLTQGTKISSLVGMPVYTLEHGKKIGSIKDVVYDSENKRLTALTLEEPGIISPDRRILPFDHLASVGRDAIMVENEGALLTEREAPDVSRILSRKSSIIGKQVITRSGSHLGNIADIFIDSKTGEAVSYAVTGGFTRDIGRGRGYIPTADLVTVGYDAIIAPDETQTLLEQQEPGGLTGAYSGAKDRARGVGESAASYVQEREIEMSRGKTAGRDVRDDNGFLVVSKGDVIDDEAIERAVDAGKVHNLAAAAGVAGAASGYASARARAYAATGEQLKGKLVPNDIFNDEGRLVITQGTIVDDEILQTASDEGVTTKLARQVLGEGVRGRSESVWEETRDRISEAWSNITERSREAGDKASRKRVVASHKDFLKGKISATDVRDDEGHILLREGEVITPLTLDNLDRAGKIDQIVLMPEGYAAEGPEDEEEYNELHVIVESPEQHERH